MAKPVIEVYNKKSIKAEDGKDYAVDYVRELFIRSDANLEELSIQLKIPISVLERHAKEGAESWYKLKQRHLERRLQHFLEVNIDNLLETHSVLEDVHLLQLIQIKNIQTFLKEHYLRYGHLFAVREGEILKDAMGMPIPLPLPSGPKNLAALESILRMKEETKAQMNHIYEKHKELSAHTIDVDDYDIFDEKDESEKDE